MRRDVDKTIVGQAADRGGDGKARNSELLAQARLVDQAARFERSGENRFLQFAVHRVRFGMGALRQVLTCSSRRSDALRLFPLTC